MLESPGQAPHWLDDSKLFSFKKLQNLLNKSIKELTAG